jgi:hypothetical protein
MAHSTVETLPGGNRSYTCIVTSVLESDMVFRCDPEVLRDGFGRVAEDMMCNTVGVGPTVLPGTGGGWMRVKMNGLA